MRCCAFAWLVLGLVLATPSLAKAQQDSTRRGGQVELLQNYPNPFNPTTTIPFRLSTGLFANGHHPVVSLRIYNILAQLVAIPTLQGSGQALDGVPLDCVDESGGYCSFSAYWDGNYLNTGREAASGIYVYQLVVDGVRQSKKMVVTK
jgi:hypothetical protein